MRLDVVGDLNFGVNEDVNNSGRLDDLADLKVPPKVRVPQRQPLDLIISPVSDLISLYPIASRRRGKGKMKG